MNRKKITVSILLLLFVCVLMVSLTACMKINMRKSVIIQRLEDVDASIEYKRTTPMTKDGKDYLFEDLIYATKPYSEGESGDGEVVQEFYVIFCGSDSAADWAEEACKKYVEDNADITANWNTYRYERIVMCGYYKLLSQARGY